MKPGDYTLEVRATSNGRYSKNPTIINIKVYDPWYAPPEAYLLYLLIIASVILYVIYTYERRRKADLEETKMQFLINATHDIRSPLTLIMGPLNKLKTRLTGCRKANRISIPSTAMPSASLLLVNQILDERKIDKNQMHTPLSGDPLKEFLHGIVSLYRFNAQERNITLELKEDESLSSDKDKLKVWIDRIN